MQVDDVSSCMFSFVELWLKWRFLRFKIWLHGKNDEQCHIGAGMKESWKQIATEYADTSHYRDL